MKRAALAAVLLAAVAGWAAHQPSGPTTTVTTRWHQPANQAQQTIYVQNFDPSFVSDATVKADIPVWERAANGPFRTVWQTPKVRLVFVPRGAAVPAGGEVMQFTANGPVQGAAAYHTINEGRPAIVIYAGIDDAFGVSLSVAVTHELFERLADSTTSQINQGWPFAAVTISHGQFTAPDVIPFPRSVRGGPQQQLPINEVCDPVEEAHYVLRDSRGRPVWISDWITPNWFNDEHNPYGGVTGQYDYLGLVQQPFTLMQGGYMSMYVVDVWVADPLLPAGGLVYTGWLSVTNFRNAKDAAFYKAERHGREMRAGSVR